MPEISTIIPVYNSEKTLKRCINSIREQTIKDWELILVDDGSWDSSAEICNRYAAEDSRILCISNKNLGSGPARNFGLLCASARYLAFVDSDDRIKEDAYENCVKVLDKENYDLLLFGITTEIFDDLNNTVIRTINEQIQNILINNKEEFRNRFIDFYESFNFTSPCNKIYKKTIISDHGILFPDMRRMQDGVFNLYYFNYVNSFCTIKEKYYYRTWYSTDFQGKKMPPSLIECMIKHYDAAINMLQGWGKCDKRAMLVFGNEFSEHIVTAELDYSIVNNSTIGDIYRKIKEINGNNYIHKFFKSYARIKKLRKIEIAIMLRQNLLLTLYAVYRRRIKKKEKNTISDS